MKTWRLHKNSFKKNTFNFPSLLAPYIEIPGLLAVSKQPVLPTAIPALSRHFPVQVSLSKTTFLFVLGVCLCTRNNCVGTCTQRPEQGIGYPPLFLFTYHLEAGYVTEPARPNEFSGSIISASRCWGHWHSQLLRVLTGVLGTLTRDFMFVKVSALTHSQNFFLTCIMHACWSFNGSKRTPVHLVSGSLLVVRAAYAASLGL